MITFFHALLLGIIQGLAEFLPISSSGHLVIVQELLGIEESTLSFDIFLHVGSLVAVFIVFWRDIKNLILHPISKTMLLLIVGTIPAVFMGFFLNDLFEALFASLIAVSCFLVLTGILLWISDKFHGERSIEELSIVDAIIVGLFQGIAIAPGLSRSGSTIFGSLLCDLKREDAARFAFLLSIPVILGAAAKSVLGMHAEGGISISYTYIIGAIVAALTGYIAIRFFIRLLSKKSLRIFSFYCWALALIVLTYVIIK